MRFLPLLLLFALAIIAWAPSLLSEGFAYDDAEAIVGNPVVEGTVPVTEAFRRDYWHHVGDAGHYRPLAALSLRLDRSWWGNWVPGYHATNVLLHALLVAGAALFLRRAGPHASPALWGLALFAAHPALADSVAWISGRTSLLSALGGVVGLLGVQRALRIASPPRRDAALLVASALGLGLGLLAKEEALVFAFLYLLLATRAGARATVAVLAGVVVGVGTVAALRAAALGSAGFETIPSPLASLSFIERLPYAGRALLEAARLAVAPFAYPPSYRAAAGFSPADPPSLFALSGWLIWGTLFLFGARNTWRAAHRRGAEGSRTILAASALLVALAFLPVVQLVPLTKVFAPRFLYLPLLFAAPLGGALLVRVPLLVRLALLALLVTLAALRSPVYSSAEHYHRAVLAEVPHDVAAWNNLGLALEERSNLDGAAEAWERGIAIDAHYSRLWSNLGAHQLRSRDYETAAKTLRRAVDEGPRNPTARCNLANALLRLHRDEEAALEYEAATRIAPGMLAAWRGLARARLRLRDAPAARAALLRALALDPGDEACALLAREVSALEGR